MRSLLLILILNSCEEQHYKIAINESFPSEYIETPTEILGYTKEIIHSLIGNVVYVDSINPIADVDNSTSAVDVIATEIDYMRVDLLELGPTLLSNKSTNFNSLEEMQLVGVVKTPESLTLLSKYPHVHFRWYDEYTMAIYDLSLERVDGAIVPYLMAINSKDGIYNNLRIIDTIISIPLALISKEHITDPPSKEVIEELTNKWLVGQ